MAGPNYLRQEHVAIGRALHMLRSDLLLRSRCWFAGGTAIVMTNGEYRVSLDIDFLCSSREGYRALRQAVTAQGVVGVFDGPIKALRDFRCDQYGLRTVLDLGGRAVKFEIVREARIELTGAFDARLGCPLLSLGDQFAEKLLANSDRGRDPSSCYRDALDLGVLILGNGGRIPEAAAAKALMAYGEDVWRDAGRTVARLRERPSELARAADALRMDLTLAGAAIAAVGQEVERVDPTALAGDPNS